MDLKYSEVPLWSFKFDFINPRPFICDSYFKIFTQLCFAIFQGIKKIHGYGTWTGPSQNFESIKSLMVEQQLQIQMMTTISTNGHGFKLLRSEDKLIKESAFIEYILQQIIFLMIADVIKTKKGKVVCPEGNEIK